jgi:hypothetical protein
MTASLFAAYCLSSLPYSKPEAIQTNFTARLVDGKFRSPAQIIARSERQQVPMITAFRISIDRA